MYLFYSFGYMFLSIQKIKLGMIWGLFLIIQSDLTKTYLYQIELFIIRHYRCTCNCQKIIQQYYVCFTQFSPPLKKASWKNIVHYHSQDTDIDRVKTDYFYHHKNSIFWFLSSHPPSSHTHLLLWKTFLSFCPLKSAI